MTNYENSYETVHKWDELLKLLNEVKAIPRGEPYSSEAVYILACILETIINDMKG